jgi:hypothetical protein
MKQRCYNKRHPKYGSYGARGITVCPEWCGNFAAFRDWSLANGYTEGLQIDREDNDGPYSSGNCRWTTRKINSQNTRRNRVYEAFGESKCVFEWSRDPRCVVSQATLNTRLWRGWLFLEALTTPTERERDELGRFHRPESVGSVVFVPYTPG